MAVPTSNLGISNLHTEVGGGATAQAALDDLDIRAFGNAYANPIYNVGTTGVPLTQGTEIALGEFRGASPPPANQAFTGTFSHKFNVYPGGQYTPTTEADASISFSSQTFIGNLMGVNATHTINYLQNSGISASVKAGLISISIQNNIPTSNPAGAYTNSGWNSIQFGRFGYNGYQYTLTRAGAQSFTVQQYTVYHTVVYSWGTMSQSGAGYTGYSYTYPYSQYFGAINNITGSTYNVCTGTPFRMLL